VTTAAAGEPIVDGELHELRAITLVNATATVQPGFLIIDAILDAM
jgi:hypothetical protein